MQTILQQNFTARYTQSARQTSLLTGFITWCKNQEKFRFGWVGTSIAIHGCFLTPMTIFAIVLSGNNMALWAIAMGAMVMTLVTNLAALSTKITIPTFLFSIILDLGIIINCIVVGFNVANYV